MITNIPIYRAKKIDENVFYGGFLFTKPIWSHFPIVNKLKGYKYYLHSINHGDIEIDPTTLAIHFPDMIDSEGTKIFASLSEDGKGGDIMELTFKESITCTKTDKIINNTIRVKELAKIKEGCFITTEKGIRNMNEYFMSISKVTGIQE